MTTKYDDEHNDQIVWKLNEHGNSGPYWQATDKDTGKFVKNEIADPFHNDYYPDDDYVYSDLYPDDDYGYDR